MRKLIIVLSFIIGGCNEAPTPILLMDNFGALYFYEPHQITTFFEPPYMKKFKRGSNMYCDTILYNCITFINSDNNYFLRINKEMHNLHVIDYLSEQDEFFIREMCESESEFYGRELFKVNKKYKNEGFRSTNFWMWYLKTRQFDEVNSSFPKTKRQDRYILNVGGIYDTIFCTNRVSYQIEDFIYHYEKRKLFIPR